MNTLQSHPGGLPPLWVVIGTVLLVGVVLAALIETGTARQRRHLDSLWAAARRHQLREHEALMAKLTTQTRPPASTPTSRLADDAITVELEVIKPEKRKGDVK